jgi:hypothetical protein
MHQTIEALREGEDVAEFWQAAFAKWREIARGLDQAKVAELAGAIGEAQRDYFEARCGGRSLGQEIMAWSGIAHFYDTEEQSFGEDLERARKIYDAIQLSHVAIDVKVHAERAAITYDLFEGLEDGADDEDEG